MKKTILFSKFLSLAAAAVLCCVSCGGSSTSDSGSSGPSVSEAVDLGLSVKWAPYNVGATAPEEFGDYFAWGETDIKEDYSETNCATYNKKISDFGGNAEYDVAAAKWGNGWRMPTQAEFEELVNECKWEWCKQNEVNGYKVTGKNGNSIFLPAAGWRSGEPFYQQGLYGCYWASTSSEVNSSNAYILYFSESFYGENWHSRYAGHNVRPVVSNNEE